MVQLAKAQQVPQPQQHVPKAPLPSLLTLPWALYMTAVDHPCFEGRWIAKLGVLNWRFIFFLLQLIGNSTLLQSAQVHLLHMEMKDPVRNWLRVGFNILKNRWGAYQPEVFGKMLSSDLRCWEASEHIKYCIFLPVLLHVLTIW